MKQPGTVNYPSQPAKRASLFKGGAVLGVAACLATTGLYAQDTPPSVYFPTSQEENVVNPEMRHWSPPRNLWPEQPGDTINPDLLEDPQDRVDTKYSSDPDVKVKSGEVRGEYTDPEERYMQPTDSDNDRPAELWPSVTDETAGASTEQTVEYSEKVKYNSVQGSSGGGYAEPLAVTPNRGDVEPTTYYVTESEEELFQVDTIGETSEGLWAEELWSGDRVDSPYDAVPYFFQPLDEVFRAVSWGPSYNGNRSRERYWNPQRYESTKYFDNPAQFNNFYNGIGYNGDFDRFDRRGGIHADFGDTYGDRNRFTYEGTVGIDAGLSPLSFRNYTGDSLLRVGPLSLADLSVSASLLYTDFNGGDLADDVDDDGFIAILSINGSLMLQLTENFYITANGSFYYLPMTGDVGFSFGDGLGGALNANPLTFARINYEFELLNWDWVLYDEIAVGHDSYGSAYYNLGAVGSDGGEDRVGRYAFGNPARSTSRSDAETGGEFALNLDNLVFSNAVGLLGTGLIARDIRGIASLSHTDYWHVDDNKDQDDENNSFNSLKLRADYVSPSSRWHPFAQYTLGMGENFDRVDHTALTGVYADITENVSIDASLGYFWQTGEDVEGGQRDSFLWELGIFHRISQYASQNLRGGSVYYREAFVGDSYLAKYIRYGFDLRLGAFTDLNLFAQYADSTNIDFSDDDRGTFTAGATLRRELGDYTDAYATVFYFENDYDNQDRGVTDGWSAEIGLDTQFLPKWFFGTFYRYTDQNGTLDSETFTEHLVLASITRRF